MGISKNAPFPLRWRGIKGEAKQIIRVFRDALIKYICMQTFFPAVDDEAYASFSTNF